MKTIFDRIERESLITRIESLRENIPAHWGKMNVYQMIIHCIRWDDLMTGKMRMQQVFIGKLFGRFALKNVLKDDSPLRKSTPTIPQLVIKETSGDLNLGKSEWIERIRAFENFSDPALIHPFFGKMTRAQIGRMVYKHIDHHLRQFGV